MDLEISKLKVVTH